MDISKTQQDCAYIASAVAQEGGRAYFVGGCVRDAIMGITSKDYDLEVYNLTCDEIKNSLDRDLLLSNAPTSNGEAYSLPSMRN